MIGMPGVSASTVGMLAAWAPAVGVGILYLLAQRRLGAAHAAVTRASDRAALAEACLASAPVAYAILGSAMERVRYSAGLPAALGIKDVETTSLADLLAACQRTDAERLAAAAEHLRAHGASFTLELTLRDGRRTFEVSGRRAATAGSGESTAMLWFHDVSDFRHSLARTTADREAFAELIDALPFPVWRRDTNLRLTFCNKAYAAAVD